MAAFSLVFVTSFCTGDSGTSPTVNSDDAVTQTVGSAGATVVTPSGAAGVQIPPGALSGPTAISISRLPALGVAGTGPLPTTLKQYGPYYEFSTSPQVASFGDSVRVGVCQVTDPSSPAYPPEGIHGRLRLAHSVGAAAIEILDLVGASDFLRCTNVQAGGVMRSDQSSTWVRRIKDLTKTIAQVGHPPLLYAAHVGLGGKVKSFSPFGAVDPSSGVTRISVTPADTTIYLGQSIQLKAVLRDDGGNMVIERDITWSSSDPAVATLSSSGLATAKEIGGPVTVTATAADASGTSRLKVGCLDANQPVTCGSVRLRLDNATSTGLARFTPSATDPALGTSWLKCIGPKLIVEGGDAVRAVDVIAWNFYLAETPVPQSDRPTLPAEWFNHNLSAHTGESIAFWRFDPEWGVGPVAPSWRHQWQDRYRFAYTVVSNGEKRSTDFVFQCL